MLLQPPNTAEGIMPKIQIENVLQPGKSYNVDAEKFSAMLKAFLAVVPDNAPGDTPAVIQQNLKPLLPQDLFPNGEKSGWWMKSVQLDQEAKGVVRRAEGAPVRLHRVRT